MNVRWRIELLGRLRAVSDWGDESDLPAREFTRFRTRKTDMLLAYLAYHLDRSHPRDDLIELLWPASDVIRGRARLSNELTALRQDLEPPGVPRDAVILADHSSIRLNPGAVTTDVAAFAAALQAAQRPTDPAEQGCLLTQAVERYGGELLRGYHDDWIIRERQYLEERYLRALEALILLREQAGDLRGALEVTRRAVAVDPLREEAHREVIRLLAATGRLEPALRHFQELKRILREEMDTAPDRTTLELVRRIERERKEALRSGQLSPDAAPEGPEEEEEAVRPTSPAPPPAATLPAGTVTFLMTEIDDAPAFRERAGDRSVAALASHHALLRQEFQRHGGFELSEEGDRFRVAFPNAADALACAVAGQRALAAHPWPADVEPVLVRMALHTGDGVPERGEARSARRFQFPAPSSQQSGRGTRERSRVSARAERGFSGAVAEPGAAPPPHGASCPVLDHAMRVLRAAYGGQILCSESTAGVLLRGALGALEPGVRLVSLGVYRLPDLPWPERLFQVEFLGSVRSPFPPPPVEPAHAGHLPTRLTRFFGREPEIARLTDLVCGGNRLVTLTGIGGSGKSRLALEVAERLVERFGGAVWFVPLADLDDPQRLPDRMRDVLGLPPSPSVEPWEQVVAALSRRAALVLLDNFEHLVDDSALMLQRLLEHAPALTCLVTSRRKLWLAAEREFPVPPLPTPIPYLATPEALEGCESVQLFLDRARAARPDFHLSPATAGHVAELCRRLEGLPLALELAAARAPVLTPAQILKHLEERLDVLKSEQRDMPPRQRALLATFDWSYRLLTEDLREFFARISVFRGSWTVEAAEILCDEPLALDYLAQLRDGSLVLADEEAGEIRFRMVELLRRYARSRLSPDEQTAVERRHAAYYLSVAEAAEPNFIGPEQVEWVERLEREHPNLRAALDWYREKHQGEEDLRLAGALWKFWLGRGHVREGRSRLEAILAAGRGSTPARLKALLGAGALAFYQGEFEAAATFAREGRGLAGELGDGSGSALANVLLGWVEMEHRGDHPLAETLFQESLASAREAEDRFCTGLALQSLGSAALYQDQIDRARPLLEESLALFRQLGDTWGTSFALQALGQLALREEEYERAQTVYEEVLQLSRRPGYATSIAASLCVLGRIAALRGRCEEAGQLLRESLTLQRALGARQGMVECLEALAETAGARGEAERSARLVGAAAALREQLGIIGQTSGWTQDGPGIAAARVGLGESGFAAAWAAGRAMSLDQVVAEVLEEPEPWPLPV